jgi:hypothetical protein
MTKDEQLAFVAKELDRVKTKVSGYILIDKIPEAWTPQQLQQFIVDEMNIGRTTGALLRDAWGTPTGRVK